MRTLAIIAEYNPFHYGHLYQLRQARQQFEADCLIVLLSGNGVQRGEFAILDKWNRAELALLNGADLVLELPLLASLQAADHFALWSVEMVKRLGVDGLAFGTETANLAELEVYLDFEAQFDADIQVAVRQELKQGKSYAAAYQAGLDQVLAAEGKTLTFDPSQANHLLACRYLQALKGTSIQALALPRVQSAADLCQLVSLPHEMKPQKILSGSQIRQGLSEGNLKPVNIPFMTWQRLMMEDPVKWDDYFDRLHYAILAMEARGLAKIQGMEQGFEQAVYQANLQAGSWSELIETLTSSRWTRSSLQRLMMMILLQVDQDTWSTYQRLMEEESMMRILAFNQKGRDYLRRKQFDRLKLFANLSQDLAPAYHLSLRLDRIYQSNPQRQLAEQIVARHPIPLKHT